MHLVWTFKHGSGFPSLNPLGPGVSAVRPCVPGASHVAAPLVPACQEDGGVVSIPG